MVLLAFLVEGYTVMAEIGVGGLLSPTSFVCCPAGRQFLPFGRHGVSSGTYNVALVAFRWSRLEGLLKLSNEMQEGNVISEGTTAVCVLEMNSRKQVQHMYEQLRLMKKESRYHLDSRSSMKSPAVLGIDENLQGFVVAYDLHRALDYARREVTMEAL